MKRLVRKRRLTVRQTAKYRAFRERIAVEHDDLVRRHRERLEIREQLQALLGQLKAARQERGLSLAELTQATGMDRSAISKLETGQRPNPTIDTLARYAEAVDKHLVLTLIETATKRPPRRRAMRASG